MVSTQSVELARRASELYEAKFRQSLESHHRNEFVAIEPESGEYFLGNTLSAAIQSARIAHPNRIPFAFRVGHPTTVNLGVLST